MLPAESIHKTVDLFLNDWSKIVYLYCLVHDFSEFFQKDKFSLQSMITIKQYSYNNLLLAYGPNKQVNVNIYWCIEAKEFKLIFIGGNRAINGHSMMRDQMQTRENNAINAHSMMRDQLQTHLNRYYNLAQTVHLLHETYQPLSSIAKLPIIPQLGILVSIRLWNFQTFFSHIDLDFSDADPQDAGLDILHFAAIGYVAACSLSRYLLFRNSIAQWFGVD
jgi:mediator of RNA polymerase II transcription subunit 14